MLLRLMQCAVHQINQAITAQQDKAETGGLLIGERTCDEIIAVLVTVPKETAGSSLTEFILDGEEHAEQAHKLIQQQSDNAEIIGIWHTHYCCADFSEQDKTSHRILAKTLDGAVSLLIVLDGDSRSYRAVSTTPDGAETECNVIIQQEEAQEHE